MNEKILTATTCIGSFDKHLEGLLENRKQIDYPFLELFISKPKLLPFPVTPGEIINCAGRALSIERAKAIGAEWILFLDADIRVDPDIIERFLKYKDYPFLAGCVSSRDDPNYCIGHTWIDRDNNKAKYFSKEFLQDNPIVDSMGGGLMMVHKSVFNRLNLSLYNGPQSYRPLDYMGSDMFFAEQSYEKTGCKPKMIAEVTAWHLYGKQKCRLWGMRETSDKEII